MDPLTSSNIGLSSEIDTIMESNEVSSRSNGSGPSGTVDPRVMFKQTHEMDLDSTEPASTEISDCSSMTKPSQNTSRKAYLPTGCCYDDRMKLHANSDFSGEPHHPEDPRRIAAIFQQFREAGLVFTGTESELKEVLKTSPTAYMYRIASRKATKAEICTVHSAMHYDWVSSLNDMTSEQLRDLTKSFDNGRKSLYVGNLTAEAALISAGSAIETCKSVVLGKVKNAFAIIRPPGHHAEHNESMGFCIFNNVPMAVSVCMQDYPRYCRKVLILDWDVHHGNGIQNMFYSNPNVLYISLHVYQDGIFYPGQPEHDDLPDGNIDKCGAARGLGKNVNIGWAEQGVGDGEYMAAFQRIVMPISQEFDPDLVVISAGFDAAAGDELGGCFVTPACYSHMTHMLMSLAGGRVAVCLEGGYNLSAISRSALAVAKTLMGEPPERMTIPPLNEVAAYTLDNVRRIQAGYWNCMRPGVIPFPDFNDRDLHRVSEVARIAQKSLWQEKFDMIPLFIQRTAVSKHFPNMVLASPELHKAKRILMIIHDPPELLVQPDSHTNTAYAHNSFLTNPIMPFLIWATSHNIALISVTLPQHLPLPVPHPTHQYAPPVSETDLVSLAKEALCYIYDNYIEIHSSPSHPISLTLLGIGYAYLGIKQLLISRDCRKLVTSVVSFVKGTLKAVKSETDPRLSHWYRENSRIFVGEEHAVWNDEESARKARKSRFGVVIKAKGGSIERMLKDYQNDAMQFMELKISEWENMNIITGGDPDETEDEDVVW